MLPPPQLCPNRPPHLIIPMSGQGRRFQSAGYTAPKPMIDVNGEPMVGRLLKCFDATWPTHFVIADNHEQTNLPKYLRSVRPSARLHTIKAHPFGPGHALSAALNDIPDDDAVLVSYCDYAMQWDADAFLMFVQQTGCDACLIAYRGFHAHYTSVTPYAYARMNGERVVEIREKGNFTDDRENEYASAGTYYFRTAKLLREALAYQRTHDMTVNGELYTSLTVQALIAQSPQAHVRVFELHKFFQWGTPDDLERFMFWERSYRAANRYGAASANMRIAQVLMPMAGFGSRFAHWTKAPKPLIPVGSQPMYRAALATLPQADRTVVVALSAFAKQVRASSPKDRFTLVELPETPPGQALSVRAGLSALDLDEPVIVSACDHGIVIDPAVWADFAQRPDCDAAIMTITGFTGARSHPNAYAYVACGSDAYEFLYPQVTQVSVKKPISEAPEKDRVLVGTFWFRSGRVLAEAIDRLVEAPVFINGELYLDSVFPLLLAQGQTVRAIDLEGYLCWGEPNQLAEALYWQETFCGRSLTRRPRFPGVESLVQNDA